MKYLKTFDKFLNVNEGLVDAIKTNMQVAKVQQAAFNKAYELIEKNPEKYKTGEDVIGDIENEAKALYKKTVTSKDAISASQWWNTFSKKMANAIL